MKPAKLFLFILLMLLIISTAVASDISNTARIQCDCGKEPCECFIQVGDEGMAVKCIIKELIKKNYLPKKTKTSLFTEEVENAIIQFQKDNSLEQTGVMDDNTLTMLLQERLPRITDGIMVYIPTDGGKKRHLNSTCSRMYDPRKVSERNAQLLGFDPCKRCFK